MMSRSLFLASAAFAFQTPAAAQAQSAPAGVAPSATPANADPADEGEEIVVTGTKPRGSVFGDIPAENLLNSRDIRATGATSIAELLTALGPQLGSARGRGGEAPVILLNGQRISGFQEIRDVPPEAIERAEILPEEVALKYGYAADQRVLNIVLRQRFRSTSVRADAGLATDGGYANGLADVSRLMIGTKGRTSLAVHAEGNSALTESERSIALQTIAGQPNSPDPRTARTLVGSQRLLRATASANRTVLGDVSATLTGEVSHNDGRSLFGLSNGAGSAPLKRDRYNDTGHLGLSLNGSKQRWRYSVTGTADLATAITLSDPLLAAGPATLRDRSRSTRTSGGMDATLTGPLATLPAGRANVTLRAGADTLHLDSVSTRAGTFAPANLARDHAVGSVSIDLPIAKRNGALGAIGSLTLNANVAVDHYSDAGTLTTWGAGLNWSPALRLNLITSFTREEGAPSINNLGDPILTTPGTRVFDYTTGQTALVTAVTGGNPALLADSRRVWKLGANWQPWEKTDLRLRADFVSSRLTNPVQTFPGPSAALEAAFPSRFTRDTAGTLTSVDFRPVNYASARSDTVRIGFDFSKPLKSAAPPQALIDQFRRLRDQAGPAASGGPPRDGDRRGGGGGGGGPFGGNQRGRLSLSLTDTIALVDRAVIRPGLAPLDFLDGAAASGGSGGGRSRHLVEAQAGYNNNGFGARLSANYRSATRVTGGQAGDLAFSPLATFDVRLFANLGENLPLLAKHPWMRGASVRIEAANLFNARQQVRDRLGTIPFGYQADLLNPIGRTVTISLRKLFIPSRFGQRPRTG